MPKFGLVLPIQSRQAGLHELLDELSEEVLLAERSGFDAVFLTEFHQAHAGALVSPLLVLAWLGARTSRIRLGTLVLATPLHDPVRLAEDALMLDWASRGRLILGLGSAHMPVDFELYGRPRQQRYAIFDEILDLVEACWSNEPFDHQGRFFQRKGHVTPRPFTPGGPPLWIGAHGPLGLRRAALRAKAWVCDPQRDITVAARLAEEYRQAASQAGRPSEVVLFREAWVGESRAECEAVWAPHALRVHRLYFNVGVYHPRFEPWVAQVADREDFTLERVAPERFLYGDAAEVRREAAAWLEATGAQYIAVRMRHPTGPTHPQTLEAIERFGSGVIAPLSDRSTDAP